MSWKGLVTFATMFSMTGTWCPLSQMPSQKRWKAKWLGSTLMGSLAPLFPAYNKFMGAVDQLSQVRRNYGFDRKSKRYWIRPFFQFFDYAVNNAHILYMHDCKQQGIQPKDLLKFRLGLVHLLLSPTRGNTRSSFGIDVRGVGGCQLVHLSQMQMPRGRCLQCLRKKKKHTTFGCSSVVFGCARPPALLNSTWKDTNNRLSLFIFLSLFVVVVVFVCD